MWDREIRTALLSELKERFPGDKVWPEMSLCLGASRVDVAVVNGHMHGYEIKSPRDNLARLGSQIDVYGRVLDYATVVTSARHINAVRDRVPPWWGLREAVVTSCGSISLAPVRRPRRNLDVDKLSIAQLLWRDEAADVLVRRGHRVTSRDTRWDLWERLAALPLGQLQEAVRSTLKARQSWSAR